MAKKMKKVLSVIISSIVVIIISLAVFIKIYITPEKIKAFLIPQAEKALNRKVNIGEINISLFKGIEGKDFTIKEIDGKTDFVKCEDFVLKYKLFPLLTRKVIIDELTILSPEIRIVRNRNGKFNFEGIGQNKKAAKVAKIKKEKGAVEQKGLPVSLLISKLTIKDANFSLKDHKKELPYIKGSIDINTGIKSSGETELSSHGTIDLRLEKIAIKKPNEKHIENLAAELKYGVTINLASNSIHIDKADIKLQKIPVSITGDIIKGKTSPEINIVVSIPKVKTKDILETLVPFVDTKGIVLSGSLIADLRLKGIAKKPESLKTDGKITLRKVGKPTPKKVSTKEAKPLDLKLTAYGEVKINSAIYKDIIMSDFYMRYQFKNNKFEISKMTAHVGKGKFNLKSLIDLSKPGYTYNLSSSLDSLHADEIVNSLFPKAKDTVYGILSSNIELSGAGTLPENIKRNLVADGDFNIKDGKITNSKIAKNLSLFLGIDELKTINLRQAKGKVKIRNGIARLDSIFSSDDISMDPSGNIGLDETLNLAFDLKLSPRLTDRALRNPSIASYIKDEEGWGIIPLKVSGTFSNPSYSVDIAKAGKRVIEKKAGEFIEDLFGKDKDKGKGTEDQKPGIKKPLEDLFKGLFK